MIRLFYLSLSMLGWLGLCITWAMFWLLVGRLLHAAFSPVWMVGPAQADQLLNHGGWMLTSLLAWLGFSGLANHPTPRNSSPTQNPPIP